MNKMEKIRTTPQIRKLILAQVYEKEGRKYIALGNSRLDFSNKYLFLGFTASGNVKLGEIYSWKENKPENVQNRMGYVKENGDNTFKLWTDGFNYSLKLGEVE